MKHVLWTGGMDSTFLLLRFLDDGEDVMPVYIFMSDVRAAAEARVREKVRAVIASELSREFQEETLLHAETMAPIAKRLKRELESAGVSVGSGNHQYSLNSIWQVAAVEAVGVNLYSGSCADDRMRGADWRESKGLILPLRNAHKTDMAEEAREKGWIPVLEQTVSCIRNWEGPNCGTCVECRKRVEAGIR